MAQIKRRVALSGLKSKKFKPLPEKHKDLWLGLTIDGKIVPEVKTLMSRGGNSAVIGENNIRNMVKELHMDNKKQFFDFINCPYKYEQYIQDLKQKNII